MGSVTKKNVKGRPYYYYTESGRINGKPRIVFQKYLGTADSILKRMENSSGEQIGEIDIYDAGGVAALLGIAQKLGVIEIINSIVTPDEDNGSKPSLGHFILLAAINRALAPCSKNAIGEWYSNTVLHRLWQFKESAFSSQRYWDAMDLITEDHLNKIQDCIFETLIEEYDIDPETVFYDCTNFFTYIATSNTRCSIAQRGKSKAKRKDLRLVGLSMLSSKRFQIPLFHRVYEGNKPDVSVFQEVVKEVCDRCQAVIGEQASRPTLVCDRGNLSEEVFERLIVDKQPFIMGVKSNQVDSLHDIPLTKLKVIPGLPGTRSFSKRIIFLGKRCRAVLVYTESFFSQQLNGITTRLAKRQKNLRELAGKVLKARKTKTSSYKKKSNIRQAANKIVSGEFMKDLLRFDVKKEEKGFALVYEVDQQALRKITQNQLGRTVLLTAHLDWSDQEVIREYREMYEIEDLFKSMKNTNFLHWQPAHHWTDSKIKVHGLYCVLGLLLVSLARLTVLLETGIETTLTALLAELSKIREVALIYPKSGRGRLRSEIALSRLSPRQKKIAEALEIASVLSKKK